MIDGTMPIFIAKCIDDVYKNKITLARRTLSLLIHNILYINLLYMCLCVCVCSKYI